MNNIKYQLIKLTVENSNFLAKFSVHLDKQYKRLTGIHITVPDDAILGSTIYMRIAGKEIFPEGFETKMISSGQEISPNDRFFTMIDEVAEGNLIEGNFKDRTYSPTRGGISYPYEVMIYLKLEDKVDNSMQA